MYSFHPFTLGIAIAAEQFVISSPFHRGHNITLKDPVPQICARPENSSTPIFGNKIKRPPGIIPTSQVSKRKRNSPFPREGLTRKIIRSNRVSFFLSPLTVRVGLVQFIGLAGISADYTQRWAGIIPVWIPSRGVPPDKRQSSNLIQFVQIFCPSVPSDGGGCNSRNLNQIQSLLEGQLWANCIIVFFLCNLCRSSEREQGKTFSSARLWKQVFLCCWTTSGEKLYKMWCIFMRKSVFRKLFFRKKANLEGILQTIWFREVGEHVSNIKTQKDIVSTSEFFISFVGFWVLCWRKNSLFQYYFEIQTTFHI